MRKSQQSLLSRFRRSLWGTTNHGKDHATTAYLHHRHLVDEDSLNCARGKVGNVQLVVRKDGAERRIFRLHILAPEVEIGQSIVGRKLVHIDFFHVKAPKFLDDSPPRMYLQLLVCAFANETNYCRRFRALSDMESPNFEARQSLSAAIYEPLTSATRG